MLSKKAIKPPIITPQFLHSSQKRSYLFSNLMSRWVCKLKQFTEMIEKENFAGNSKFLCISHNHQYNPTTY